jgi:hypothetical protein
MRMGLPNCSVPLERSNEWISREGMIRRKADSGLACLGLVFRIGRQLFGFGALPLAN